MPREQIGVATLAEAKTQRRLLEVAAWFEDVTIPAGEYPITAGVEQRGKVIENSVRIELAGTITASAFPSLFGGLPVGSGIVDANSGRPSEFVACPYASWLAKAIVEKRGLEWLGATARLLPGWAVTITGHGKRAEWVIERYDSQTEMAGAGRKVRGCSE